MTNLKKIRLICGLRLVDVWANTGIPSQRISLAERGNEALSQSEKKLLEDFLRQRWDAMKEFEARVTV